MRRKSTRNTSKSTPETKTETRKSTRSSRRRKSPSVESDNCTTAPNADNINDNVAENTNEIISNTPEQSKNEESITETLVEDERNCEDEKGGHTPPSVESTGNDTPKKDEVDAEKGKSKGLNNSQVEENSEIQMNSVTTGSPEEAINNEVNPDVVNISVNQIDEISETPNIDSEIKSDVVSITEVSDIKETEVAEKNEESFNNSDVKTCVENESDEKCIAEVEESENVNGDSEMKETETDNSNKNIEADDDQTEEGEIRESKSDEENEKSSKESPNFKAKKTPMRIKLRRDSFFDSLEKSTESDVIFPTKKMTWDSEVHKCFKISFDNLQRLDVEDFKSLSSDLKLAEETEVKLEDTYQPKVIKERVKSIDTFTEEAERPDYKKQISTTSSDDQENTNIIAINRKISIVDDSASKLKPPPSPAKQPVSPILFISNLVRPFTLKQLKELLERTGTIKEGGFWTDRIKSKCYVWYDSIEEAEGTRNALHGVNWPVGNGKKLIIEFATEEEMEKAKNPPAPPAPQPVQITPPVMKSPQKENTEPAQDLRNGERREERKRKDSEREKERVKPSAREWDIDKDNKERVRSRSRDRRRKYSGKRSPTPLEDFIAKKQRKLEESVPQKLMDDLFQRTKAMPCIYWQPLSPEEISVKQQQRLSRMEEHKRRLQENSRNRGGGARDRGSYRRRYD